MMDHLEAAPPEVVLGPFAPEVADTELIWCWLTQVLPPSTRLHYRKLRPLRDGGD
jgi:hypothetical protein